MTSPLQIQNPQNSSPLELLQFTCEICTDPITDKFTNADICSHPFCTDCIIRYIHTRLHDHNDSTINCPSPDCDRHLDLFSAAPLLGRALFVRWCDVLCEKAILELDKCYCPYRRCNELILNECGAQIQKKNKCPRCKRLFCFQCRMAWHQGFGCGEVRDREDVEFGRLAEQEKWKRCPSCRHFVELRGGCRMIRCRCGVGFCYKCGKQVYLYHRCDGSSIIFPEWCHHVSRVLILVLLLYLFFTWLLGKHGYLSKHF